VIVTLYVPTVEELKVQVDDPVPPEGRVTLDGAQVVVTPVGDVVEKVIVPEKPLMLLRLMLEVPVEPVLNVTAFGLAVRLKSWTV
jgi:hypothetical protein